MLHDISKHGRIHRRMFRAPLGSASGMTLLELIIACAILLILSSAALPIAKVHRCATERIGASARSSRDEGCD